MIFTLFFFLLPFSVDAYLDAGTGGFIIHVVVGLLVGISYGIRLFWRNIKMFFNRVTAKIRGTHIEPVKESTPLPPKNDETSPTRN
jgi:hypothetical protein